MYVNNYNTRKNGALREVQDAKYIQNRKQYF